MKSGSMEGSWQFLAAQTLKIASMNGLGELDKLESELEDEINYESQAPPRETLQKVRRKLEHFLHSKPVLLVVVVLNVIDCLLVLGELTFDFNHVGNLIKNHQHLTEHFLSQLQDKYPDNHYISKYAVEKTYDRIVAATIDWTGNGTSMCDSNDTSPVHPRHKRASGSDDGHGGGHSIEEEMGHGFHLTSVAILSLLVFITALKIGATVPRFFRSKMQVFDAVVILISFIIDLVFIEGVMSMDVSNYVIVLTFLLPWRIIRILNSLIVAVLDKHRFQMKLLYKQKKKIDKQYQEAHEKNKQLLKQLESIKGLCSEKGITSLELGKALDHSQSGKMSKLRALGKLAFHTADTLSPHSPTINGHGPIFSPTSPTNNIQTPSLSDARRHSSSTPNLPVIDETHVNVEDASSNL
ncbi:uncharacterized protein LOC124253946 isoform X2 [Haliotis rubra]|uniref:uncharacterized protein LOC124253946 isoform X2 n=1 Tax=Haliotis rubra TaxID=36100 RepID=UPI001EE559C5|nr:uncharacterized protein LOC124253946 isoform X2 [Haliotis rubra]